jgi:hypothetical protein
MTKSKAEDTWLLIDDNDCLERELIGGFSMFERKGARKLEDRPRCPLCMRPAFSKAVISIDKVKFTGTRIGDVAYDVGGHFIVSKRFLALWHESKLTGLNFSPKPIPFTHKKNSTFTDPQKEFFLAIPEPRITQFLDSAEAIYTRKPPCRVCASSEVKSIRHLYFQTDTLCGIDCCLPSCLPGWVLINSRFRYFIEKHHLMNFTFLEGFQRLENRTLTRKGYWWQHSNGQFERFSECSEEMLVELCCR